MLFELESMEDGQLRRINTTKHRIKLKDSNTHLDNPITHIEGPDNRKLEKVEIGKILADSIIESAHAEWS